MSDSFSMDYCFTNDEIRALVLLLREHEAVLHPDIDSFRGFLESYIYHIMTIEEAEAFFNEQ
ncbi:MAG TPA: hypothetical protein VJ861_01755 [Treponemataceae bacterium]|nr:hypothetical protein [Treponemataceae bacterium]